MKDWTVYLWPGHGYFLAGINVKATNEADALDKAVAAATNSPRFKGYYFPDDDPVCVAAEKAQEEVGDYNPFIYVDATLDGARTPVYIYAENLKITPGRDDDAWDISELKNENKSEEAL